jgi:hypothetical protein
MVGFGPPPSRKARRKRWRRQIQRQHDGSLTVAKFCRPLGISDAAMIVFMGSPESTDPVYAGFRPRSLSQTLGPRSARSVQRAALLSVAQKS